MANTVNWKYACEKTKDAIYSSHNPTLELGAQPFYKREMILAIDQLMKGRRI